MRSSRLWLCLAVGIFVAATASACTPKAASPEVAEPTREESADTPRVEEGADTLREREPQATDHSGEEPGPGPAEDSATPPPGTNAPQVNAEKADVASSSNSTGDDAGTAAPPLVEVAPSPVDIVVRNGTAETVELDVTFGPTGYLSLADVSGELAPFFDLDAPSHCPCLCKDGELCPRCARPRPKSTPIAPGKEHRYAWNGHFQLFAAGKRCTDVGPAVPGRYLFRACGQKGGCAVEEVELPASSDIVLTLDGSTPSVSRCPLEDSVLLRLGRVTTTRQAVQRMGPQDSRAATCEPRNARCVDSVEALPAIAANDPCLVVAIPHGEKLEGRLLFPPREGEIDHYSVFTDAMAVTVQRGDW